MNNFTLFLIFIFIFIYTLLLMTFPERAETTTECLVQLGGALCVNKVFLVVIAYFNRNKK